MFAATFSKNYPRRGDLTTLAGSALLPIAQAMTQNLHPALRELINLAEPGTVIATPLRIAGAVTPWESPNITLLGDAIHSMPPTRGIGGNIALKDLALFLKNRSSYSLSFKVTFDITN